MSSSASLLPVSLIPGGSLKAGLLSSTFGGRSSCCDGGGDLLFVLAVLVGGGLSCMVGLNMLDIGSVAGLCIKLRRR